jgi:glucosamine--fructose-6-phosphate aminotransferase (isomerizing)
VIRGSVNHYARGVGATADQTTTAAPGTLMAAEMAEQPSRLAALLARRREVVRELRALLPDRPIGTVLVARGSSDHAATCGRYLLEMASGRPVSSASPSVHTLYRSEVDFSGHLVVAVSQSGRTPEIVEVVERARATGGRAVAITNDATSPLARSADMVIALEAGDERAVPATKTVTCQLAAFAMLAQALGEIGLDDASAGSLPGQVAHVLADVDPAVQLAEWLLGANRLATVARGLLYGAAAEAALKIEETTSVFASAFSAADLRHGPIAIASTGIAVLAFAHPGPACADVLDLVEDLAVRGARTKLAGPVPGSDLPWPAAAPEALAPILAVARAQQLARFLALRMGRNPDAPSGLTKVTVT